ncbi:MULTISPECIES: hypothetical protein [unclassified Pseudomonas]|uniref:hypothetical protein n=1 Tax=unclassified Pseudomonas TaxID=196821 RepID=UPI0018E90222|nr:MULTISPECIES: hypothetical protein [unclassified Pseudomonas]MBJ2303487.1 hypothetical protein [Pseudomonas sp. MF2846]MBK3490739.1 hypothetical protein [Pseudomonas sp. MF2857]
MVKFPYEAWVTGPDGVPVLVTFVRSDMWGESHITLPFRKYKTKFIYFTREAAFKSAFEYVDRAALSHHDAIAALAELRVRLEAAL